MNLNLAELSNPDQNALMIWAFYLLLSVAGGAGFFCIGKEAETHGITTNCLHQFRTYQC